ncbi:MAG: DUF1156 domain-containing protein [Candidatus Cloacimonetes bacterium]|nr:DUF1156 domain-containing protein [Candidatus Cloacimonadota bacterium]
MQPATVKIISPKKLIEVALPLDKINEACAKEKMPGIGAHPRGLHQWWARRPLAAARAVIFAQLVHDPEDLWRHQNPGVEPNPQVKGHWSKARTRLFDMIEKLVLWENTTNETLLKQAREVILESWRHTCELNKDHPESKTLFNPAELPGLHDPFAGGGAIPLEAQRLGLKAFASDLNPVAVMINKAMIEIPPRFSGQQAINPKAIAPTESRWGGASGLAEDVRCYGEWMRLEAQKRIGQYYPKVKITKEMAEKRPDLNALVGQELTVIAWLWARTVKSPNPAFARIHVPLVSTFILSSKAGKEAFVEPVIEGDSYRFEVRIGKPPPEAKAGTKLARGANFKCLLSGIAIEDSYIYQQGKGGQFNRKLLSIVADGPKGRLYLSPSSEHEVLAAKIPDVWKPTLTMPNNPRWFSPPAYGMLTYGDLFTPRQLLALTTFSDLVIEARELIRQDAIKAGLKDDGIGLSAGGSGALAYAEAVSVYLGFSVDRSADFNNTCTRWVADNQKVMNVFDSQSIAMTWDYPEANTLADVVGGFATATKYISKCLRTISTRLPGKSFAATAQNENVIPNSIVSTDPPYFDNIGYADLSDFFYVWLRRSLRSIYPDLFATIAVPKDEELIATPYRHQNSKQKAEQFFLNGMTEAMKNLAEQSHPAYPITIYYAFKQSKTKMAETSNTGWETFLDAVLQAGLQVCGTWPVRSEQKHRRIGSNTNALASSIVLVCRKRDFEAKTISRRQFIRKLNETLPVALAEMTRNDEGEYSPVAPVDLSQAIIGPGMAIFSEVEAVLEADGSKMSVKSALQLINRFLAEADFDTITHFCLHWLEQMQFGEGSFGEADVLARAKGTSVEALQSEGVLSASAGKVRLYIWQEINPEIETSTSAWFVLHAMIQALNASGDSGAARILARFSYSAEILRQLSYRLYTVLERKGFAEQARVYNEIITGWDGIDNLAQTMPSAKYAQQSLQVAKKK